jgi:hypothetical protein
MAERGDRVFRVVYNPVQEPWRVVTAYAMRAHFDQEGDAVDLRLDDSPILEAEEVHPGIVVDFTAQGASRVSVERLKQIQFGVA